MWQIRLLDKAAYQTAVEALDAFERGDPSLLAPLVARCHAQQRSEEFARRHRVFGPGFGDVFVGKLDKAMAERDMVELSDLVIALTAMPDFQLGLDRGPDDSPNLVEMGDHDCGLYSEVWDANPGFEKWWTERCQDDIERYPYGLSMFLLSRESLVRLQGALRNVTPGPSSNSGLVEVRDRLLDLIARSLADERTTVAVSDIG